MAETSAKAVMKLRAMTNAGMMACKDALTKAGGDMEKAVEILRKKGVTWGDTKGSRASKEGVIGLLLGEDFKSGVLLEVNCETDFVARNKSWRTFVDDLTQHAHNSTAESLEELVAGPFSRGRGTVDEAVKVKSAETGEVMVLRRFIRFTAGAGSTLAAYLHPGEQIGVMVEVAAGKPSTLEAGAFKTLLKDIAMQIAAANPQFIDRGEVPPDVVERERAIYAESERLKGKPTAAMEGILNGMLNKFYSQTCLLDQSFVKDLDQTISDLIKAAGKSLDDTLTINRFTRFAVGQEVKA